MKPPTAAAKGASTFFGQTGEAAGALFAGVLYAQFPLLPFLLQLGVWVLALALTRGLAEPRREPRHFAGHLAEALASARYVFIDNRRLRVTILFSIAPRACLLLPGLADPALHACGRRPPRLLRPGMGGSQPDGRPFRRGESPAARVPGRPGYDPAAGAAGLGGYLGLGLAAGVWGFLFYYLLTAMRGVRGPFLLHVAQAEIPSANPGRDALAPVPLLPAPLRPHRTAGGDLCRRPRDQGRPSGCSFLSTCCSCPPWSGCS